ncbi:uncharacterized protein LOC117951317 [Etheostoma cragini]|uniref:uncharacterized protein LOC117951317 n=1 Tax=Etheostoma cragini TaxID=417921 RepID=UPI00155EE46E|nr:uncharacterized protein LOC117951317 [Etheostoma cragini]
MEACVSLGASPDSTTPRNEDRAAALRFVAESVLSERKEKEEQEDICFNILSSFINSLDDRQWETIRDRMREPLTQAHLAQVSTRIIGVVSELVFQVLVPALTVNLQTHDSTMASPSKSSKEEETPCKHRRSPPIMPASSMLGEIPQQVDQDHEQAADVKSASKKSVSFVDEALFESATWQDIESFLDPATGEVMSAIVQSLDTCPELTEGPVSRILKQIALKIQLLKRSSTSRGKETYSNSQKDKIPQEINSEARDGSPRQDMVITYPMTVSPEEVVRDLSCSRFRAICLRILKGFLMRSMLMFSSFCFKGKAITNEPNVDSVASDMLDTVLDSVKQLSEPQPRKWTFPWHRSENTTVSEKRFVYTAVKLKTSLEETMRKFYNSYKELSDKLREEEKEEARRVLSDLLSNRSDDKAESSELQSFQSTATESVVNSMADVVKCFLDETEQLLKQDDSSVLGDNTALTGLEKLISQDKLFTFSKMLADKLACMFNEQAQSAPRLLASGRKAWSDSELSQPTRRSVGVIMPTEQVYVFVEEAVKRLMTSLIFPPPSWGMGTMIKVQSGTSATPDWEESTKKYEASIQAYCTLIAQQVIQILGRVNASSKLQQEVIEPKKKKNIIHFLKELSNNIMRNCTTRTNKEA